MDVEIPQGLRDQLLPLLRRLVSIDSVNPSLVPGGSGEAELAEFVAGWLKSHAVPVTLETVSPGRPNVLATVDSGKEGRSIVLNAHLDTVGVAAMNEPFSSRVEDGRLFGRGAMDTKGGLAALMLATAAAAQLEPPGKVIFTAVVDEECASLGTESLIGRVEADAAIVSEPTGLDIVSCHKGFVWLDVETLGVAAHGSRFQDGVDAIVKMGKFLSRLEDLADKLDARPHPILGPPSIHASLIEGGQEMSSYPARCRVGLERRTVPGETVASVHAEIQELIDDVGAQDPDFRASVRVTLAREPLQVDAQSEIVEILAQQARERLQGEPAITGMSGWTDAALLTAAGIPSVVFGPRGEGLHGATEWVDLESVGDCAAIVFATIERFCRR
jgi:acetylornithine deacetylase